MSKFTRSRAIVSAVVGAVLMSLMSVAAVFAGSSNGPYPG